MRVDRRNFLGGGAVLALASAAAGQGSQASAATPGRTALPARLASTAIYVPGYHPKQAYANGRKVEHHKRIARAVKGHDGEFKLLTRLGMDGSIRQALMPVDAHDVEVAPDKSVGVLCGFEARDHAAFDPDTLDMVAFQPSFGEGWRGGGHAVYIDGGGTVLMSERAPQKPLKSGIEPHYGRITVRDPKTLKIADSFSTHAIDPHDIRVIDGGRYLVAANYGSVIAAKTGKHTLPRSVVDASITVIDLQNGQLVDKYMTRARDIELRHLAAGSLDRIFAIQAKVGHDAAGAREERGEDAAYEFDLSTDPGIPYLSAATLRYDARRGKAMKMGGRAATNLMRHGLSIKYDGRHDEAIASYPTSHHVMVFDGATGAVTRMLDTRTMGLRYPSGITMLPDGVHYAVAGYWENLFVFERGTHRLVRDLCLYPVFFGHSHITAA